jgi:hypothetical protein
MFFTSWWLAWWYGQAIGGAWGGCWSFGEIHARHVPITTMLMSAVSLPRGIVMKLPPLNLEFLPVKGVVSWCLVS